MPSCALCSDSSQNALTRSGLFILINNLNFYCQMSVDELIKERHLYPKEERSQAGSRERAKTQQGFMRSDLG
jgi:hypothetical protein